MSDETRALITEAGEEQDVEAQNAGGEEEDTWPPRVGQAVKAKYPNGIWYPAKIAEVKEDGTYLVNWDDGDTSNRLVPESKVVPKDYEIDEDDDVEEETDDEAEEAQEVEGTASAGGAAGGTQARGKRKDIGAWKARLTQESQPGIPEEKLHDVKWANVGFYFAINMATLVAFFAYAFMLGLSIPLALPFFIPNFLLAVMIGEHLRYATNKVRLLVGIPVVLLIGAGFFIFHPMVWVEIVARTFTVVLVLVLLVLAFLLHNQKYHEHRFHSLYDSQCLQALSGTCTAILYEQHDFVKLAKAIFYEKVHPKERRDKAGVWSRDDSKTYDIYVGMTRVDEGNPDIPDITFCPSSGSEITPFEYMIVSMTMLREDESKVQDKKALQMDSLQKYIKGRKVISDRMLDKFIDTPYVKPEGDKAKEGPTEILHQFLASVQFPPNDPPHCLVVWLRRRDYWSGVWDHWAPRAAYSVLFAILLAVPAIHLIMETMDLRGEKCGYSAPFPKSITVGDFAFCGGKGLKPCAEVCANVLNFGEGIRSVVGISQIETMLPLFLLPVFLFIQAVAAETSAHGKEEAIFLQRMREPKKNVREVITTKETLEKVFQITALFDRFVTALRSWWGADPALTACGPITDAEFDLTVSSGANNCFKQVMMPVSSIQCSLSAASAETYAGRMYYGIAWHEGSMIEDANGQECSEKDVVENGWKMLKFRNDLGTSSGRNYKVLFDVKLLTPGALDQFKKWTETAYKKQMEFLCDPNNSNVQDNGIGSHLLDDSWLGDCLVPKGFSLTHVYVAKMPEDGAPCQIEVGAPPATTRAAPKPGEHLEEFWNQFKALKKDLMVKTDDEDDAEEVMTGEQRLANRLGGACPVVVRFAISEQYYNNFSAENKKDPLDKVANRPVVPNEDFTKFVDFCLTSVECKDDFNQPSDAEPTFSALCAFMGDEDTSKALVTATIELLKACLVYLQCLALVLVIPVMRVCQGGRFLPSPFTFWLVFNIVSIWTQLVVFFSSFHATKTRLSLVADCLALLETKTIEPTKLADAKKEKGKAEATPAPAAGTGGAAAGGTAAPAAETGGGGGQGADKKKGSEDLKPFDLFVQEDTRQAPPYDPTNEWWKKEFKDKTDNVKNWYLTVSYLRVFVSTSRITAQSMLMAAFFVIGCLLLLSLVQAMRGQGAVAVDTSSVIDSAKDIAARRLMEGIHLGDGTMDHFAGQSRRLLATLAATAASAAPAAAASGALGAPVPLTQAVANLREALQPVHMSFQGALKHQRVGVNAAQRRLGGGGKAQEEDDDAAEAQKMLEEDLDKMKKLAGAVDVRKATKTQLFTLIMAVLVMMYTVPLMWNIVLVNGYFDRHDDLLLKQKEQHRMNHAKREVREKKGKEEKKEGEAQGPSASETARAAEAAAAAAGSSKDVDYCGRYEKMLEMTIETARKTRERFPLTLFGFVISTQLLATWIFMAASPMVDQAKQMAPGFTMLACEYVENSPWIDKIQSAVDAGTQMAKDAATGAVDSATDAVESAKKTDPKEQARLEAQAADLKKKLLKAIPKISLHTLIHENICIPLKKLVGGKVDDALSKENLEDFAAGAAAGVGEEGEEGEEEEEEEASSRRLSELRQQGLRMPDLEAIVVPWWQAHSDHSPETRMAVVEMVLGDLHRDGAEMLQKKPRKVLRTFRQYSLVGIWRAVTLVEEALEHPSSLRTALALGHTPRDALPPPPPAAAPAAPTAQHGSGGGAVQRIGLRRSAMLYRLLSQLPEKALARELEDCGLEAQTISGQEARIEAMLEQLS